MTAGHGLWFVLPVSRSKAHNRIEQFQVGANVSHAQFGSA